MTAISEPALPASFRDAEHLEEVMTTPSPALVAAFGAVPGDLMILGVGGKMGPTLARLAKRAHPRRRVIGVARFSEAGLREKLEGWGVECIAADLLDRDAVAALPRVPNIVFMAGRKFGSTGQEELTWAMNVLVPATVAEVFRDSTIVAFSTGNVYPFVRIAEGGAGEEVAPDPVGTYANSCVGRERMFEYFSRKYGTRGRIIRLNYAIDMRYGVLHDIAEKIATGAEIDLTAGHVNVIWQGDANEQVLRAFGHATAPTSPLNVSGPEIASVRALAIRLGERLGKAPRFTGTEAATGWAVDCTEAQRLFGYPRVPLGRMIDWVADWVGRGQASLGKPTHYESRDGHF
ncbi:MAG TPA: NAD-dependent epimerase/dehydratase family protein [Hyphomicrobiales bacterium]|nr:NAD-dependent epimerase/dehydratase family protein [Hyphomicrobiales bacterium]